MKDLLKIAIVLPICFNPFLYGQTAYSSEIYTFEDLTNTDLYDNNTQIMNDIRIEQPGVERFYTDNIKIYGNGYTIDGNRTPYDRETEGGTGFAFFDKTNVTIENLNFTNYTHRERGTIYLKGSTGILNSITMTGYHQEITDGNIWGSMVALVDSSIGNVIKNSTFQDVDLKLNVSTPGGIWDVDGGVMHIQGSQSGHQQSDASIISSHFLNNKLESNRNVYGGAVYNEGVLFEVSDSEFKGNLIEATGSLTESVMDTVDGKMLKTGGFGGALSLGSHNSGRGNATIKLLSNTLFENNTVSTNEGYARGGALWSGDDSIIEEIRNCTFKNNLSKTTGGIAYGGAIYSNGRIDKIVGSLFEKNTVESPDQSGVGGAIYSKNNLTIQDGTIFQYNTVKYNTADGEKIISNDIHVAQGADIIVTTSDKDDATKNFVSILGGISSSQNVESELIVQDGVTLNLSGKNDMFNGQTTVKDNSVLNFIKTQGFGSFVRGTVNVEKGSTVNFDNELAATENNGYVTNLVGGGYFNKTGIGHVEIQNTIDTNDGGETTRFTGNLNLAGGSLTVKAAPQAAAGDIDFTANIGSGTTFTYYNGAWNPGEGRDDKFTLDENFGLKFDSENSNSTLNFKGHGTFNIKEDILNAAGNNISITDSTTSFASNTYDANYNVTSSTITLQDKEINNVVFNNSFTADGISYKIDFDFTGSGDADKISANAGNAKLRLDNIAVLHAENDLGQLAGTTHNYTILNGATFNAGSRNIESDIYKYTASTTKDGTDLILTATGLKADTLYLLNHVKGVNDNRYFYFLGDTPYNVNQDLKETLAGTLYVNGKDTDPSHSIITGDNQYSFFQNNGNDVANLFVNNVTLQNGLGKNGIAAVLDINQNYTASFDNVVIKDNKTEGGLASAISNNGGTVNLKDVTFSNNTGAGSYIYNSGTMKFETTSNRDLTNGAIGATGNKITNDTNGIMNFVTGGNTYTIKSAIENNGTINITENSTIALTNNSGITVTGNNSGIINVAGNLKLTDNTTDIVINSGLSGSGNIEKTDSIVAEITGDNSGFRGNVDILGGTLKFSKTDANAFFGEDAVITVDNAANKGSTLDYTTNLGNVDIGQTNISLNNNATLKFSGRDEGDSVIKISENIVTSDSSSNNFIFNNADYTIGENVSFYNKSEGSADNIIFNDAKARFEIDDKTTKDTYHMGNANWVFNNSEFRFLNKVAGDKYEFENLTMNNSKISLDLDLTLDEPTGLKPYADTFNAKNKEGGEDGNGGKGGVVEIIRIGITADNGKFYHDETTDTLSKGVIQIFTDKDNKLRVAETNDATILNWGTNAYKYDIKSASSGEGRTADSIEVTPIAVSTTGTLRELNRYEVGNGGGNRGFSFIVSKDAEGNKSNNYNIYRDLDTTSEGAFSILGTVDEEVGKSILDGTLKEVVTTVKDSFEKLHVEGADVYYDGKLLSADEYSYNPDTDEYTIYTKAFTPDGQTQGSMFEIENNTEFYMSDVVVQNAKRYADDKDKPADHGSAGIIDGSVIFAKNADAAITLKNVDLKDNSAEIGNGGAIANILSNSFEIENMKADSNTAGGLGGAIYTESNMKITDSDFGTAGLNYHKTAQNKEQNDIYIAGENTKLEYYVSDGKTTTINSGLAGDGQFVKKGEGTLNLNGKNDGLTGLFAVDAGKVLYTKDTADDSFAAGNVSINAELEMAIADGLNETIENISGSDDGVLTKSGDGILNLNGNNNGYTGTLNINDGIVRYTAANATDSYIDGVTNIAQEAALDYIANQPSVLSKVAGTGSVNYSGSSALTFDATNNLDFNGVVNANGTQLNVSGAKTDAFDFGINIQNGKLNYTAAEGANLKLDNTSKVVFAATGLEAIFNGGSSYTLGNIENVAGNTVAFQDTTVKVSENSYTDGRYELRDNTILSLADAAASDVSFENLYSDGGKLAIDVDLNPLPDTPKSDVLNVNNGDGVLTLTEVNVLNSRNNKDNGLNSSYTFDVIKGTSSLTLSKDNSLEKWATNVYEYDVDINDTGKGIIMSAVKASDENSLKAMNQYEGTRGFEFRENDDNPYVIGSGLGTTAEGIFTVNGTKDTVISGDKKYSFFDVQNKTDLTINDVTITNAYKEKGTGSVIYAENSEASIVLNNVILEGNKDKNGKNDIYIAKGASVNANNSSINSGLAGSGTFNAKNTNLSGENNNFTGILNVTGDNGLTFVQSEKSDSYIKGTTNVGVSSVTLNIDKGNTVTGNFTGNGTLNKEGSKDIVITGDNSSFTGDVNIKDGSIVYDTDKANYFGGSTNLEENGGLKVSTNKAAALSQISGEGTLSKDGKGTLVMAGDNSGFNGDLNINNGIFALAAGSSLGKIENGLFEGGTAISLQNTSAVQDENGEWTTNPEPASIENLKFNNLELKGDVGFNIDVDLKKTIADTIEADTVSGNGHLVLGSNSINVVSDSLLKNTKVQIASGAIATGDTILLSDSAKTVMGPIQKYDVSYGEGYLGFARQGGSTPSINSVNPAVMASVVATQGGYLTQLQTLLDGFYHMDRYTKYSSAVRLAAERNNRYAVTETPAYNKPILAETEQAMWIKPYTSFETVGLKGGIDVSNITYGTLYGGDTDLIDMGHGFKGVISTFVGYNGAQQSYKGISMNQNGGSLGVTGTLYKGNFFTGLTASTGASTGDASTLYGRDNFTMLTAGIANKTGYNWEINEGKLIVQPSVFLGYTFVNTFDYTNSAGVRMDSDPLHAITIEPGVKFIGNLNNGWQPYAGVDMVWNVIDKTNVMANDVRLPQLSVKPYVQYGVGVQKSWGERFTAFFQTMIRNGGRNGVMLTGGFRWALGKKQVSGEPKKKKVFKKLEDV